MATPAHKSATSVTLAPLEEKSAFELFVLRYWKHAAALAALVAVAVVIAHQRSQASRSARAESWDALASQTTVDPFTRGFTADAATWANLAAEYQGREAGPWARLLQADQLVEDRKYDEARAALAELRSNYADHPLLADIWRAKDDDASRSLVDIIEARIQDRAAWESSRPGLFGHPPIEADAPRVALQTSKGEIVVALFPSKAPEHTAKFLELVESDYFDGMAFHAVAAGQSISAGDPNTKTEDTATWGAGGRDVTLPYEESGLHHFAGALSAEEGATEKQSLPGRFSIFVADSLLEDDSRVVFGVVESGLDVAKQIAATSTDPNSPGRPVEAIRISSAEKR